MTVLRPILAALALSLGLLALPARAGDTDPLFILLGSDEPQRAVAGLTLGLHQHQSGHPLTLFLSDRAVLLGARSQAERYAAPQQLLQELLRQGAMVLVSPVSMRHHGVSEADLLPGLQVGNRQLTGEALFRSGTRTLSW